MPPNDTEPRYRLVDSNGNVVGSLFVNGDGDVAIQDRNANEVSLGAPGLDLSGNALTDSTQSYLNFIGDNNNLRVATGSSIEDGSGTVRYTLQNDRTRIQDDSAKTIFEGRSNTHIRLAPYNGTPLEIFDGNGIFSAVNYLTSSSTPGTLELTNALLNCTVNVSDTDDSMTANPETDTESGYITVEVNGAEKQIPVYDP